MNEQIRDKEVRLLGENGELLGVMSAKEAMAMARNAELDLVKIAPKAEPPVCKLVDAGKYRYELLRREKEKRKKQKVAEVKGIQITPNIEDNDMNTKANQAIKFIQHGDKVKISLKFRGREMAHTTAGMQVMNDFFEKVKEVAVIEKPAKLEGRNITMVIAKK